MDGSLGKLPGTVVWAATNVVSRPRPRPGHLHLTEVVCDVPA